MLVILIAMHIFRSNGLIGEKNSACRPGGRQPPGIALRRRPSHTGPKKTQPLPPIHNSTVAQVKTTTTRARP